MKNNILILLFLLLIISCAGANQISETQLEQMISSDSRFNSSHLAEVTSLAYASDGTLYSADKNGFVISRKAEDVDAYQFSHLGIQAIAVHPSNGTIALYETDGFTIHRISVWDWRTKQRKFFKVYTGEILSMSFSAKGTYLILGTVSAQGAQFLNARTGASVSLISDNTGIISFTKTNEQETSLVTYSLTGRLSYYDLKKKKLRASFSTEQNLEDVVLYNNNLFLVGKKNNNLYKINAVSGEVVETLPITNPLLFMDETSTSLLYAEESSKGYTIHYESVDGYKRDSLPLMQNITSVLNIGTGIIFGTTDGALLFAKAEVDFPISVSLINLTQKNYNPILDFVIQEEQAHYITENSYFIANIKTGEYKKIASISGYSDITPYSTGVLLWAKGERKPLSYITYQEGSTVKQLYIPSDTIDSVTISGDFVIIIDGGKLVRVFDLLTQNVVSTHTGSGFESATVLDSTIYVAKSTATSPFSPLININISTGETAAELQENLGDMAYALTAEGQMLYGVLPKITATSKKTTVFSYNVASNTFKNVLTLSDEDASAELVYFDKKLYTTLGKTQITILTLDSTRNSVERIERSAVLPSKVAPSKDVIFVLNMDGTISTYTNDKTHKRLSVWYVSKEEELISE